MKTGIPVVFFQLLEKRFQSLMITSKRIQGNIQSNALILYVQLDQFLHAYTRTYYRHPLIFFSNTCIYLTYQTQTKLLSFRSKMRVISKEKIFTAGGEWTARV